VRGVVWCDHCWEQRAEDERRQDIRGKRAERALWTVGISSAVPGYGTMFAIDLYLSEGHRRLVDSAASLLTVFGGTMLSMMCFGILISVYTIREWLRMPPEDR
jgi:hypothetical protein